MIFFCNVQCASVSLEFTLFIVVVVHYQGTIWIVWSCRNIKLSAVYLINRNDFGFYFYPPFIRMCNVLECVRKKERVCVNWCFTVFFFSFTFYSFWMHLFCSFWSLLSIYRKKKLKKKTFLCIHIHAIQCIKQTK